jgi:cell division protein FtsL
MLTDWSIGVEARNYKIPHRPGRRCFSGMLGGMCCVLLVAVSLVGFVWIRYRIIALGYEIQKLDVRETSLLRDRNVLIAEEETLKSPERIDGIARNELGMEPLSPYQRLIVRSRDAGAQAEALAMADAQSETTPPRRPSISN